MQIKGLDYNTQREFLVMPEYGREIQKMVDHAATLPTRRERNIAAKTIIGMMATKVDQQRSNEEHRRMLWDHLYLISHRELDIDWPYDMAQAEKFHERPKPLARPKVDDRMRMRHYGRLLEQMFDHLATLPAGRKRDKLTSIAAHQMKRILMAYGHGSHENERVADDLARYTDGKIQLDLSTFRFARMNGGDNNDNKRSRKKK